MNHEKRDDETQEAMQELKDVAKFNWAKVFRVLLWRIPAWLLLVVLIGFGSLYGYSKLTQDEQVNLKPAVENAVSVEINIFTCNKQIDEKGFNIRDEEQKIEKQLKESEGVKNAKVLIERDKKNCEE